MQSPYEVLKKISIDHPFVAGNEVSVEKVPVGCVIEMIERAYLTGFTQTGRFYQVKPTSEVIGKVTACRIGKEDGSIPNGLKVRIHTSNLCRILDTYIPMDLFKLFKEGPTLEEHYLNLEMEKMVYGATSRRSDGIEAGRRQAKRPDGPGV